MTSHAALVARGWGKCCIVGCGALNINASKKVLSVNGKKLHEGDWISLNGTKGVVYDGKLGLLCGVGKGHAYIRAEAVKTLDQERRRKATEIIWTIESN